MIRFAALLLVAAGALASCTQAITTASGTPATNAAPTQPAAKSKAQMLAEALAQADLAASSGKDADLARPLAIITALDARPLDAAGESELAQWQRRNPDTTPPLRGRTLGPGYRHGTLDAGDDLRIEQTFLSGQRASIALSSPDGAKLRLNVIDGAAKPVCQHVAARPSCEWTPVFTQRHVIQLTNPGQSKTRFYLVID